MQVRPDERRMAAWRALLEAHAAAIDQLGRELRTERGLPLGWYDVLVTLARAPGRRLRMQELAGSVLLSKSGLTRMIDRMEGSGLVSRERCDADRRGAFAVLTRAGMTTLRNAAPVHLRGIEEHFARHLSDEEAEVVARALGRVGEAGRTRCAPCDGDG